jgi:hypothetical protein
VTPVDWRGLPVVVTSWKKEDVACWHKADITALSAKVCS